VFQAGSTPGARISPRLPHLALALFVGCGGSSLPRTETVAPASARTPSTRLARDPACGAAEEVLLRTPPLALSCREPDRFSPGSCGGKTLIQLINCTSRTVQLLRVEVVSPGPPRPIRVTLNFDRLIRPGERYERRTETVSNVGRYRVTAHLGPTPTTVPSELQVTNPLLARAQADCRACQGVFGAHGMSGTMFCLCRMPDAGKPCTDGDQCQGKCVSTPEGYRCSKHRTVFGCHSYLPKGWSRQLPARGIGRRVPHVCAD
jgi:hypothetical protein